MKWAAGGVVAASVNDYLTGDEFVPTNHPAVQALALQLRENAPDDPTYARLAYEWVRDEVAHSYDASDPRVTLSASEVLEHRVGLCYAKSHLLVALLRAQRIPAGLCYQRLTHGEGHVLHGLVALHLGGNWHRQDPRGNRPDVNAEFSLHEEKLAWQADESQGETDYPQVLVAPARCVVDALRATTNILAIYEEGLPTELIA